MLRKITLVCAAMAVFASAPAWAAELVQNGGFETPGTPPAVFAGWATSGDGIAADSVFPNDGAADAFFSAAAGDANAGTLSQSIPTVSPGNYVLSFALMDEGAGTYDGTTFDTFTATLGGFSETITFGDGSTTPFLYQTYTAIVPQADLSGPITTLTFQGLIGDPVDAPGVIHLDDVSISAVEAGVPEPHAWILLITGLGLTGAVLRRRRLCAAAI